MPPPIPPSDENYHPPVGFHFSVNVDGLDGAANVNFQAVSGLNVQLQTDGYKEGGENRFEHALPTRTKYSDLVLKRGIVHPSQSGLTQWVQRTLTQFPVEPKNLVIHLLGDDHLEILSWKIEHAFPKGWKVSDLNADKGEIVIETLELAVNRVTLLS
ncbi:MAG: phage tail protein [Bacteroidota bacterium]